MLNLALNPLKTGLNQNYISVWTSQRTQSASTTKFNIVEGRRCGLHILSGVAHPSGVCTATSCYRNNKQTRKDSGVRFVSEHIRDLTEGFSTKLDWSVEPLLGNLQGTRVAWGLPESDWKSADLTTRRGQRALVTEPFWAPTSGTHPNKVLFCPPKDRLPFVTQVVHMTKLRPPSKTVK